MIKRLGMWNRLALVSTILAAIIFPVYIALDIQSSLYESKEAWYDLCMSALKGKEADPSYISEIGKCSDDLFKPILGDPWGGYWTNVGGTIIGCAIIYLFLWLVVATIRWILAGRKNNS